MRQELNESEKIAVRQALASPAFVSAVRKFCENHDWYHTRKVREQQNLIPETENEDIKRRALAALHGGMSKAYGTMFAELQKAVAE